MTTIATTGGDAARARPRGPAHRGPLDRVLGVFTEVRAGEGLTALLLMLDIFLLLAGYYLLKTIREPLILTVPHGAEVKSYAAAAMAGLLLVLVPAYGAVAARVTRVRLINGVTGFFMLCLLAFFALHRAGVPIGIPFFIWVGIFNMMIVAQLWAFANDVYTVEQGQRLFAIVGFGASIGAIAGSFATGQLVARWGPYPFLLGAFVLLGLTLVVTNLVDARERRARAGRPRTAGDAAAAEHRPAADDGIRGRNAFALVFSDRYLLLIAAFMLVYNLVNTNGEYILGKTIVGIYQAHHPGAAGGLDEQKVIGQFYGGYFTWVNLISAGLQAFVVSRVLRWFGVRAALLFLPIVSLAGYAWMAFVPVLTLIRGTKIAENSLDYSLQNTTRNALYLPTSRDAKYKAKQANDSFFVRMGDVVSAGLVFGGTTWLGMAPRHFALANAVLILGWIGLAIAIGRRFHRMARRESAPEP